MSNLFRSAFVIARRDFVATVWTKYFLAFLFAPLLIIGVSILFGRLTEQMARQDTRANIAVIASPAEFDALVASRERVQASFGEDGLPELVRAEPDYVIDAQVRELLASRDKKILAVLTGGLARPKLTGDINEEGRIRAQMTLIVNDALRARQGAQSLTVGFEKVSESAGSVASLRALTARAGQLLLFMVTVLLAGMLLSNLVEEKSNKVIEVLAAAIPVDAIFLGKLFAMLAVSLVGITVWAAFAGMGLLLLPSEGGGGGLPTPAVGWPIFVALVVVYYAANYLLLGALFLGIGSQAASVREVQILSMPVTVGQMLIFLFASAAVGPFNSPIGIAAAVFPFSSPLAMIARAAQTPELWPHLLALAWQALWVWLTIKITASLFRRNVMKSGTPGSARPKWRLRRS
ncbi:MAG TPA: ABC transporter permease [Allosphingosinicella sp.]|uniref:ABC transporter permease n=1 Tax=Allosphingosinicella sp. TaxID=2823234 RepID=UPI002F29BF7B